MNTRIAKLLRIKYPILLSGMGSMSIPKIVAAVSNARGLGITYRRLSIMIDGMAWGLTSLWDGEGRRPR